MTRLFHFLNLYYIYAASAHAVLCLLYMWGSEHSLQELALSFHVLRQGSLTVAAAEHACAAAGSSCLSPVSPYECWDYRCVPADSAFVLCKFIGVAEQVFLCIKLSPQLRLQCHTRLWLGQSSDFSLSNLSFVTEVSTVTFVVDE